MSRPPMTVLRGALVAGVVVLCLGSGGALPAGGQSEDDGLTLTLPGSGREVPLRVVEGDVFVLSDHDWCENVMALAAPTGADGFPQPADPLLVQGCADFMSRLAENDVALLPLSLAGQVVALPDEVRAALDGPPEPMPMPTHPSPSVPPITSGGYGESTSDAIALDGRAYTAQVAVSAGCEFFAAFLTRVDDGVAILDVGPEGGFISSPSPGAYRWEVVAPGCAWGIALEGR
ncbi:hypothetical protein BH23CHL8_BH23CHL8_00290 [soil metagenome]